ncbi:hypothetical protein M432DRAFT_591315 [Thermoascus aurantiacus ATCC 26904]
MAPPSQRITGWIWPKDPRPGNPPRWPRRWRLFDVLTNKGPDIFVGTIDSPSATPHTPRWSRWQDVYGQPNDGDEETLSPFFWADRGLKRYDFRTRTYQIPDRGTWSRVEYCDGGRDGALGRKGDMVHEIPLRYWDWTGNEYPAWMWHDRIYGAHDDHGV